MNSITSSTRQSVLIVYISISIYVIILFCLAFNEDDEDSPTEVKPHAQNMVLGTSVRLFSIVS